MATANKTRKGLTKKKKDELRKKVGGSRKKMDLSHLEEQNPDKVFRWMNNEQGRIQSAMQLGWEVVTEGNDHSGEWRPDVDKSTSTTESSVTRMPVGLLRTVDAGEAIAMMIDKEIFQELRVIEEEHIQDMDRALKGGAAGANDDDVKGVQTYAAETASGSRGFEVQTEN